MTEKQQNEIKCLDYFSPIGFKYKGNDKCNAEEEYFRITQDGKKKNFKNARLEQLLDAKKWRLRMMEMYENGVLEGSVPYYTILEGTPKVVKEFMAKTMFKGYDKELILNL